MKKDTTEPTKVFDLIPGCDAAHRGITDFYARHLAALKKAFRAKANFDTGWYAVKHEIESGRISRTGALLHLEVSRSMDDGRDLVDTLIWEAAGGNAFADSGWDALDKAGFTTDETKESFMDDLLSELTDCDLIFDENDGRASSIISTRSFPALLAQMETLSDICSKELGIRYANALQHVKERIENLKGEAG